MSRTPHRLAPPLIGGDPHDRLRFDAMPLEQYDRMVPPDLHPSPGDAWAASGQPGALPDDPDDLEEDADAPNLLPPPTAPLRPSVELPRPEPVVDERPHRSTLSPQARDAADAELRALVTRLIEVKDTIDALEPERRDLTERIRPYLQAGHRVTVDGRRATLRPNTRRTVDYAAFEATFGAARATECAVIDLRRVDELVRKGQLSGAAVRAIVTHSNNAPSLYISPAPE